jgi:hypothetical protein
LRFHQLSSFSRFWYGPQRGWSLKLPTELPSAKSNADHLTVRP